MKLEDFEYVDKTFNQRNSIIKAMKECEQSLGETGNDCGCYLSRNAYGANKLVNMIGCEVTNEILEAVEEVLSKKLRDVDSTLETLGVEIPKGD